MKINGTEYSDLEIEELVDFINKYTKIALKDNKVTYKYSEHDTDLNSEVFEANVDRITRIENIARNLSQYVKTFKEPEEDPEEEPKTATEIERGAFKPTRPELVVPEPPEAPFSDFGDPIYDPEKALTQTVEAFNNLINYVDNDITDEEQDEEDFKNYFGTNGIITVTPREKGNKFFEVRYTSIKDNFNLSYYYNDKGERAGGQPTLAEVLQERGKRENNRNRNINK